MTAKVVRSWTSGGGGWRDRAVCSACDWKGGRFKNPDSADRQARKHNEEKHS